MKIFYILLTFSIVICLTNCKKDKQNSVSPSLTLSTPSLNLSAASVKDSIQITSNVNWTISGQPDWLSVNPASGKGETKVFFTFQPNKGNTRTASLLLKGEGLGTDTIHVTQTGIEPSITSDKTILNEPFTEKLDSIVITSNVAWNLSIQQNDNSWISADKLTDTAGISVIHFNFAANNSAAPKATTLKINAIGSTANPLLIKVNQEQPDVVINYFTPNAKGGDEITITGSGFSTAIPENYIEINGVIAEITGGNANELKCIVPKKAGSGKIKITVNSKSATSSLDFTYDWIGVISTFVGQEGAFRMPEGIDFDKHGNLFVADYDNYQVKKVSNDGKVTILPGRKAPFYNTYKDFLLPSDVKVDTSGNVYVVEFTGNAVTKVFSSGDVKLLAGGSSSGGYFADGTGTAVGFQHPSGIDMDASGNLIIADEQNNRIRKVTQDGVVTTIAGRGASGYANGKGSDAIFNFPFGIAIDKTGNYLVTDLNNGRIRKVTPKGDVTTFVGVDASGYPEGSLMTAPINHPSVITIDANNNIYFADGDAKIYWITPQGEMRIITPDVQLRTIGGIAVDTNGIVYISDTYGYRICKLGIQ